jgi:DNA gyrase inhibitor GyrI
MRVASVRAFSAQPEGEAGEKLVAWAEPKGLFDKPDQHRVFGFNNPDPAPGSPNYGYEFWIVVGSDVEPEEGVEVKEFPGGLYAVTRCDVPAGGAYEAIPATWQQLVTWCEDSKYRIATHQWLEEHLDLAETSPEEGFVLKLYLPIAK